MESNLNDFREWVQILGRFASIKSAILDKGPSSFFDDEDHGEVRINVFTNVNEYSITAKWRPDHNYLGCIASSRKCRAGEDWSRGRDLADGRLTTETWHQILADIVSYEMVKLHGVPMAYRVGRGMQDFRCKPDVSQKVETTAPVTQVAEQLPRNQ